MRLTVISSEDPLRLRAEEGWTLPFAGLPGPHTKLPPHLAEITDGVMERLRTTFPSWLWTYVQETKALTLAQWPGPNSWWWYTPLSEMSPMRSPIIRKLYQLLVFQDVLSKHQIEGIEWYGDDYRLASAAEAIAQRASIPFQFFPSARRTPNALTILRRWTRRIQNSFSQFLCWLLLNLFLRDLASIGKGSPVALFTRYPILWQVDPTTSRERMYGPWPQYLKDHGVHYFYAAIFKGSPLDLIKNWRSIRRICQAQQIRFLETTLSFGAWMEAHVLFPFINQYRHWKKPIARDPILFEGINLKSLWWDELDANVLDVEIPLDRSLAAAFKSLHAEYPTLRLLCHPFEYQPMERALYAGLKGGSDQPKILGIQCGMFGKNQMGLLFPKDQVRTTKDQFTHAPLPDFLAPYNEYFRNTFSARLGEARVSPSGSLRYSVPPIKINKEEFRQLHRLPDQKTFLLLAPTALSQEALPLLEAAVQLLSQHPSLFVLAKFHYHLPLQNELRRLAEAADVQNRVRLFDSDLEALFQLSDMILTSGSAVGIEAMSYGCMPLVYKPIGEMPCNPMLDCSESVFVWSTFDELSQAAEDCLRKNNNFVQRQSHWPQALQEHLGAGPISPSERLFAFLQEHKIL